MSFVSYAQNYEDVMLWRALKHVKEGFYIDVGAWSPDEHSVTRVFGENGWRGINIEPNPYYFAQLLARRPKDINLALAVGERGAAVKMHLIPETGLSTGDANVASVHASAGRTVDVKDIDLTTLTAIWSTYVPADQEVHFLKIDVEGFERAVISGNDWANNRPWIVVVEAISPLTHIENHVEWEEILLSANYVFCYADRVNRYYVANEHSDLVTHFKYPPNIFDPFITAQEASAEAASLRARVENQRQEIAHQEACLFQLTQHLSALDGQIHALKNSTSWKVTAPLRRTAAMGSARTRFHLRRTARAVWWAVTPWHIPARMRLAREQSSAAERASLVQSDGPAYTGERAHDAESAAALMASDHVARTASLKASLTGRASRAAHTVIDPLARPVLRYLATALSRHLQQVMAEQNATALAEMRQLAHEVENVVLTLALERQASLTAPKSPVSSGPDDVSPSK